MDKYFGLDTLMDFKGLNSNERFSAYYNNVLAPRESEGLNLKGFEKWDVPQIDFTYEQLEVEKRPDLFIFHSAVGLRIQNAIDKINPQYAIFSHAWELGHSVVKWRWTIDDLLKISGKITGFDKRRILLPTWGDKIVYTKATQTVSGN